MNYEGKSVFDLSGGGGNDPQVAINKLAINAVQQVGFIAAFGVNLTLPSTGATLLSDTRSIFYTSGYVPNPAQLQLELYQGANMIVKKTDQQQDYGFRWIKPDGLTTAVFEISVRAAFYSRTDTNINVGLRADRKDISGNDVIPKEFQTRVYPSSPTTEVYTYTVDLTYEFDLPGNVAYIDFSLWGGVDGAGTYEVTFLCGSFSNTQNQISIKRIR